MFSTERFIEDCCSALNHDNAHAAVKEIVATAVADPSQVLKALGEPKLAGVETLYRSDRLTILNVLWGPFMRLYPHNHLMWAVIGIYGGREDNAFYRRSDKGLIQSGAKSVDTREVIPLGDAIIHSVTNPLEKITAAIHVYGGDFFATPRSEWDPRTLEERPYDVAHLMQAFEESNAQLRSGETAINHKKYIWPTKQTRP
jgi:predicted metal-dependent enzyme (double-stranded beta helix superfamily)